MTIAPDGPQIGDLVKEREDGPELVVTDIRAGCLVVRPLHSGRDWPIQDPGTLTVLARRGTWGGQPGGGTHR
jgi:hypothetical protein